MKIEGKNEKKYVEKPITKSYNEQKKEGNQRNVKTKMLDKQVGVKM